MSNSTLKFRILYFLKNHLSDVPYSATILFWMFSYDYKVEYISSQLKKLSKVGYVTEYCKGVYIFNEKNYKNIKFSNPELAKQIKQKEKSK